MARTRAARLRGRSAFFQNVIVNRIYSSKRFTRYVRAWDTDTKCFFHTYYELERIDGIQAEPVWTEQWQIITDLFGSNLQHQISDEHLLDLAAQIGLRHK